jgi:Flp pilus assembly pilin Flp
MNSQSVWMTLWRDESGAILSAELVIVLTVVVIGLITGLTCLQQAVVAELQDVSAAISSMNQSFFTSPFRGCLKIWGRTSGTAGSMFIDRRVVGTNLAFAELGVGNVPLTVGPTFSSLPLTVTPPQPCVTCPPVTESFIAPAPVPCPTGACPPETCPPGTVAPKNVIPQGPAPQLSPQSW